MRDETITEDARAEALQRYGESDPLGIEGTDPREECFIAGAEWHASRKVEAAPSDIDREALLAKWDDTERPDGWNAGDEHHLATLVIAALRSTPQPVRFEVTDEMVERMARVLFARTTEAGRGWTWPINGDWGRQRDMEDARKALARVLGATGDDN